MSEQLATGDELRVGKALIVLKSFAISLQRKARRKQLFFSEHFCVYNVCGYHPLHSC